MDVYKTSILLVNKLNYKLLPFNSIKVKLNSQVPRSLGLFQLYRCHPLSGLFVCFQIFITFFFFLFYCLGFFSSIFSYFFFFIELFVIFLGWIFRNEDALKIYSGVYRAAPGYASSVKKKGGSPVMRNPPLGERIFLLNPYFLNPSTQHYYNLSTNHKRIYIF